MKVLSNARPVRVAYLVEQNDHSNLIFDAIACASYGRWAGRFHLVVPVKESEIDGSFVQWMERYDPDVIYSYANLSDESVRLIHERFYPSFLTQHQRIKGEGATIQNLRPEHKIPTLSVETIIPLQAQLARNEGLRRLSILEACHGTASQDRFVQNNFGSYHASAGRSYPRHLEEYAESLHILRSDELKPRHQFGFQSIETVENRAVIISQMAKAPVLTMANLSALRAPRLSFTNHPWSRSFSIIVGDTFLDRIAHWNSRFLYPRWRDGQPVQLWLSAQDSEDNELVSGIAKFLKHRNQVCRDENHYSPTVTIYSSSVPNENLQELATKLKEGGLNQAVSTRTMNSFADFTPSREEIQYSHFYVANDFGSYTQKNWQQDDVIGDEINIEAAQPDHLQLIPTTVWSGNSGAWAVDMAIERANDLSPTVNKKQNWLLPRRLRMVSAFAKSYQLSGSKAIVAPRVSSEGFVTLFADKVSHVTGVKVPTDETAIRFALMQGRDWWPFEEKYDGTDQMPSQLVFHAERSNNGSYFWGTLGMFGDLEKVRNHLLAKFWVEQFSGLGGSFEYQDEASERLEMQLRKTLQTHLSEPVGVHIQRIAKKALKEAERQQGAQSIISWNDLKKAHDVEIDKYWIENPRRTDEEESFEIEERNRQSKSLEPSVKRLCKLGVLHQGYEIKCINCLHRNWISIDDLVGTPNCEVCHSEMLAPISSPWQFRLNGFLREAIRTHGILPLCWALEKKRKECRQSFFYEGPLKLFFTEETWKKRKADGEIDLTFIVDGKVEMLEVKNSSRNLNDLTQFAEVVKKLRPDVATIAVMEPVSESIRTKFSRFSALLKNSGIEPRLMTLGAYDLHDGPELTETTTISVFG